MSGMADILQRVLKLKTNSYIRKWKHKILDKIDNSGNEERALEDTLELMLVVQSDNFCCFTYVVNRTTQFTTNMH